MTLDPFTRSGHLTDLGLEARALDALGPWTRLRVDHHLRHCEICQARAEALGIEVPSFSGGLRWVGRLGVGGALVAALVLLWPRGPEAPLDFTRKGPGPLQLWVHDGTTAQALLDEGPVGPGDRLGFRLSVPHGVHAMIVPRDAQSDHAMVYPEAGGRSVWIEPEAEGLLPVAVRLDASQGDEWFFAVLCADSFDAADALQMLDGPPRPGCDVWTRRIARGQP